MVCGLGSAFLPISILCSRGLQAGDICWPGATGPREEELRACSVELPKARPLAPLTARGGLRGLPRDPEQGLSLCLLAARSGGHSTAQLWGHRATAYSHRPNLRAGEMHKSITKPHPEYGPAGRASRGRVGTPGSQRE